MKSNSDRDVSLKNSTSGVTIKKPEYIIDKDLFTLTEIVKQKTVTI